MRISGPQSAYIGGQQVQHTLDMVNPVIPNIMEPLSHETIHGEKQSSYLSYLHHSHHHPQLNPENQSHQIFQPANPQSYHHPTQSLNQANQSISTMNVNVAYKLTTPDVHMLR